MTANETTTETTVTEDQKNDKRAADFMKVVKKLGEEASLGRDSLPKLAHVVVKAVADGVLDVNEKDAKGNDLAHTIFAKYSAGEGNKALHERNATSIKAQASKLRQIISMAAMTTVDAVDIMQSAYEAREAMIADSHKVKSAYPFYVDVAREQLKTDKALSKQELEDLAIKDGAAPKTLEGELKRVMKVLEGLVTGENRDKIKDDDELTAAAFYAVKDRLDKIATLRQHEELREKAAALGLTIA